MLKVCSVSFFLKVSRIVLNVQLEIANFLHVKDFSEKKKKNILLTLELFQTDLFMKKCGEPPHVFNCENLKINFGLLMLDISLPIFFLSNYYLFSNINICYKPTYSNKNCRQRLAVHLVWLVFLDQS